MLNKNLKKNTIFNLYCFNNKFKDNIILIRKEKFRSKGRNESLVDKRF